MNNYYLFNKLLEKYLGLQTPISQNQFNAILDLFPELFINNICRYFKCN